MRSFMALFLLSITSLIFAEPTETRTWTSSVGSSFEAKAIALSGGKVALIGSNGKKLNVALTKLSAEDQAFLKKHFRAKPKPPTDLPVPLGVMSQAIKADQDSSYFVYLPKSLDSEVPAPVLLFQSPVGGGRGPIMRMRRAAEITGIALASAIESKNASSRATNLSHTEDCLGHIKKTLHLDTNRAIFSGSSGGGAMSFYCADKLNSIGAIPYIGYLPQGSSINKKAYYHIGGGAADFNRYPSAHAAVLAGKKGLHRIWKGGHNGAGEQHSFEGVIWVYTRHIYEKPDKHSREIELFEGRFLTWLQEIRATEPHTAYYWCHHLLDACKITGGIEEDILAMKKELSSQEVCTTYLECFNAIQDFSKKQYAPLGENGTKRQHSSPALERAAQKLHEQYPNVPELSGFLLQLAHKTG